MNIQSDLQACENMISVGSTTFYHAFSGLPSPRKEAVYVIYSFCRMIDDAVDEPEKSEYTLEQLRTHFDNLDQAEGHFIWPSLRWLFDTFPVEKQPFYLQMDGQQRDYVVTEYDTIEQLEQYCYLVAGTVGEMLLPVLHDFPDERVSTAGIFLGKAMQIVNIIRDVGEDLQRGRRYLPLELLHRHHYTELEWRNGVINRNFINAIEELALLADRWFERGLDRLETYPLNSAFCIRLAAAGYHSIIDAVRANDYDVFAKRAFVSEHQKKQIYQRLTQQYLLHKKVTQEGSEVS